MTMCMKEIKMYGMGKVWMKGQIVIPKNARDDLWISSGDDLFIMTGPHKKGILLFKADSLDMMMQMLDNVAAQVRELKKQKSEE